MGVGRRAGDVTDLMGSPVVDVGIWEPADDSRCMIDTAPGAIAEGDSCRLSLVRIMGGGRLPPTIPG